RRRSARRRPPRGMPRTKRRKGGARRERCGGRDRGDYLNEKQSCSSSPSAPGELGQSFVRLKRNGDNFVIFLVKAQVPASSSRRRRSRASAASARPLATRRGGVAALEDPGGDRGGDRKARLRSSERRRHHRGGGYLTKDLLRAVSRQG